MRWSADCCDNHDAPHCGAWGAASSAGTRLWPHPRQGSVRSARAPHNPTDSSLMHLNIDTGGYFKKKYSVFLSKLTKFDLFFMKICKESDAYFSRSLFLKCWKVVIAFPSNQSLLNHFWTEQKQSYFQTSPSAPTNGYDQSASGAPVRGHRGQHRQTRTQIEILCRHGTHRLYSRRQNG